MTHVDSSAATPAPTARFEAGGAALAYEDSGAPEGAAAATPLVFIHGWTADRHRWDHQMAHFAATRRVVRLDLRGHGQSDKPRQVYTLDGLAEDVRSLLDALGVDRFIPVGHSMGGMITQTLALKYPERVERIVLVDSLGKMVYNAQRGAVISLSKLLPYNMFVAANIMRAFKPGYPRDLIRGYIKASQATPRHVVMSCYEAMRGFDVLDRLGEIEAPALIVHGYYDIQFPPSEGLRLAMALRHAVVKIVDAGHESPVENPEAITAAIEQFVG
ncbi:MAG TPA: alpha/beta hydrolase [Mycobacterium sp.]|nr:alpha/beta hydrolase [Mycobacterium sp.]